MATRPRRERYRLTFDITSQYDPVSKAWLYRRRIISVHVANLRNRPLTDDNLNALGESIPLLYGRFTGDPRFSLMEHQGLITFRKLASPFSCPLDNLENGRPCPLTEAPAAVMVSTAGSRSSAGLVTPALPEKSVLATLRADPRNQVCPMQWRDVRFTRVISTVRCRRGGELKDRWRVTDYTPEGSMVLSVFCSFPREMMDSEREHSQRKRKASEESSNLPPAKRSLRL